MELRTTDKVLRSGRRIHAKDDCTKPIRRVTRKTSLDETKLDSFSNRNDLSEIAEKDEDWGIKITPELKLETFKYTGTKPKTETEYSRKIHDKPRDKLAK